LTDRLLRHDTSVARRRPSLRNKSVAVLPLVNESGDANALYFSDGLSKPSSMRFRYFRTQVIARHRSFQFRSSKDPVASSAELGVAHLLEGQRAARGDAVRISAELIDVRKDGDMAPSTTDRPVQGSVSSCRTTSPAPSPHR